MNRPVVMWDIDGVLADFTYGFTYLLEGKGRSGGTQPTWNFDAPRGAVAAAWRVVDDSLYFWRNLLPLATWQERLAMQHLAQSADFLYVTGREDRGNNTRGQTIQWLYEGGFPQGTVVLDGDKRSVASGIVNLIGVIDDKPDNLLDLSAGGYPVYAMSWPYNRHVKVPTVTSVAEFCALMQEKIDAG